jgi:hypothetical protein
MAYKVINFTYPSCPDHHMKQDDWCSSRSSDDLAGLTGGRQKGSTDKADIERFACRTS